MHLRRCALFGYVRVNNPELKVREYEFYRGTYCGLCRSMGKCTGQCSRMTLSYDFAFLALLRITLEKHPVAFEQKRCLAHPLKRRNSMNQNPALTYCAGAAALLNYHKILDDLSDERGFKKLRAILIRPFVAHARRKAIKKLDLHTLDASIAEGLAELSRLEQSRTLSVDRPAEQFGSILADIMAHGLSNAEARVARAFGMAVGKWIYIADALDDWQDDEKKKRYNPFLDLYGGNLPTPEELQGIKNALKNELFAAEAALDLVEFHIPDIQNIVQNILYLGMPDRIEQIKFENNAHSCTCQKHKKQKGQHDL